MWTYVTQAGPFILLQFVLALVVLTLVLVNAIRLAWPDPDRAARVRTSIDAILFWAALTAVFGVLGQWSGLNRVANVVIDRGVVNPGMILFGLGESLHTTVFGMFTLVIAGFLWFALRAVHGRRMAS